jgi:hypothetical protein
MSRAINVIRDNQIIRYTYWDRGPLYRVVYLRRCRRARFFFLSVNGAKTTPGSLAIFWFIDFGVTIRTHVYAFMMITVFGSLSCTWTVRITDKVHMACIIRTRVSVSMCNPISGSRWSRKARRRRRYAASHCFRNDLAEAYNIKIYSYYYSVYTYRRI